MRCPGILLILAAVALGLTPARAAPTDAPAEAPRCSVSVSDPHLAVRYCTDVIAAGQLKGQQLAYAYAVRAHAQRARQNLDAAIADFGEAIAIDPHPRLLAERGHTFSVAWKHDEAIADFEKAAAKDRQFLPMFERTADWFAADGYFEEAIPYLDAALRASPNKTELLERRGDMEHYLGRQDAAIGFYETALRIEPETAHLYEARAIALIPKGEPERALRDLDRALQLQPKSGHAHYTRARALFDLDRFGEAAEDFDRARQKGKQDTYVAIWRYLALRRDGKDGRTELRESARRLDIEKWPAPVIGLLFDAVTPDQLIDIAMDAEPRVARGQRCEALFFIGQHHVLAGRKDEAIAAFEATVGTGVLEFIEYWHAKIELRRFGR